MKSITFSRGLLPEQAQNYRSEELPLLGTQEFEKDLFFGGLELFEFFGDLGGFAAVSQDGVGNSERGTDLSAYSQAQLDQVALRLNQRLRETLGFQIPASKLQISIASTV